MTLPSKLFVPSSILGQAHSPRVVICRCADPPSIHPMGAILEKSYPENIPKCWPTCGPGTVQNGALHNSHGDSSVWSWGAPLNSKKSRTHRSPHGSPRVPLAPHPPVVPAMACRRQPIRGPTRPPFFGYPPLTRASGSMLHRWGIMLLLYGSYWGCLEDKSVHRSIRRHRITLESL